MFTIPLSSFFLYLLLSFSISFPSYYFFFSYLIISWKQSCPPTASLFIWLISHQTAIFFFSEQTSHYQPSSSTFLSYQISISNQPPDKQTGLASQQPPAKAKLRVVAGLAAHSKPRVTAGAHHRAARSLPISVLTLTPEGLLTPTPSRPSSPPEAENHCRLLNPPRPSVFGAIQRHQKNHIIELHPFRPFSPPENCWSTATPGV
jgi:hypothetical protein